MTTAYAVAARILRQAANAEQSRLIHDWDGLEAALAAIDPVECLYLAHHLEKVDEGLNEKFRTQPSSRTAKGPEMVELEAAPRSLRSARTCKPW